jgi:hypothetical protein
VLAEQHTQWLGLQPPQVRQQGQAGQLGSAGLRVALAAVAPHRQAEAMRRWHELAAATATAGTTTAAEAEAGAEAVG